MIKITICLGSTCHIKGSRQVVERFQNLIEEKGLDDEILLGGAFCMGKCPDGVCVKVNDNFFSVTPDMTDDFFEKQVIPLI